MRRRKIVIVGGGSNSWAPDLVKDMMLTPAIADSEFVLYDIDKSAATLVRQYLMKLNEKLKTPATFTASSDLPRAFERAEYIIITISTGGFDAMAHDLAIPEKYGIFHTVGDTSGPGGWARLMRNFSVFKKLAEDINRHAPGAMVLNYSNPMTTLTQILCRICTGPVVGLCHGLFENLEFLKRLYKLETEDQISVRYAGLNHFFWMTEARIPGMDILADLSRRLEKQTFTDLMRESSPDPKGFHSNRELATELFRLTGVMPYLGDRHTCEFFPQYITSKKNMKKYKMIRTSIKARRNGFNERKKNLEKIVATELPEGNFVKSREAAAEIISAHVESRSFIDVGNVPNIGQISNLPLGTIVETAVCVDRNGFSPIAFGPLPEPVLSFVEPFARAFNMGVDACFEGDRGKALTALRMDPVCSHLTVDQVLEMGNRLLAAHGPFIKFSATRLKTNKCEIKETKILKEP
jgi:alpha-galactosidase